MKVSDLHTSLWNGEVGSVPSLGAAVPVRDSPLLGAFRVSYGAGPQAGRVTGVELLATEPLWAHNMKRALAALLQLDLSAVRNPAQLVAEIPEVRRQPTTTTQVTLQKKWQHF